MHMRVFEHVIGDVVHSRDRFLTAIEFHLVFAIVQGLESIVLTSDDKVNQGKTFLLYNSNPCSPP